MYLYIYILNCSTFLFTDILTPVLQRGVKLILKDFSAFKVVGLVSVAIQGMKAT